jgi:hypothetical protein
MYRRILQRLLACVVIAGFSTSQLAALAGDHGGTGTLLDRAVDVRAAIAAAAQCEWKRQGRNSHFCVGTSDARDLGILLSFAPDGNTVRFVRFSPLRGRIGKDDLEKTPDAQVQQRIAIDTVAALFPSWAESRQWLASAIQGTSDKRFEAGIRIENTSIYVSTGLPSDQDVHLALIFLTRDTNMRQFRLDACWYREAVETEVNCPDFVIKD